VGQTHIITIDNIPTFTMKTASAILALLYATADISSAFVPASTRSASTSALLSTVDDKTEVREYFNTEGFNRWNKIYSESDDVNSVQLDIRTGHDQTIQKILNWIADDGDIAGKTVCDCGCGVGSLAIPLAQMGEHQIFFESCQKKKDSVHLFRL
jgi:magnesium-protoporphyrin O-methyltransferase